MSDASASLSAVAVDLGDIVDLIVRLDVPPGVHVTVPATLESSEGVEPHGPPRWRVEAQGSGSVVTITYPLQVLGLDPVRTPEVMVSFESSRPDDAGVALPGQSRLELSTPPAKAIAAEGQRLQHLASMEMQVRDAGNLEGILQGLEPSPLADVLGPDVSPALGVPAAIAALALAAMLMSWRRRRRSRTAHPAGLGEAQVGEAADSRASALATLDALRTRVPVDPGALRSWLTECDAVIRRYVESLDATWGPHMTCTELVALLSARRADGAAAAALGALWRWSEGARLGARPLTSSPARAHAEALRAWLSAPGVGRP